MVGLGESDKGLGFRSGYDVAVHYVALTLPILKRLSSTPISSAPVDLVKTAEH